MSHAAFVAQLAAIVRDQFSLSDLLYQLHGWKPDYYAILDKPLADVQPIWRMVACGNMDMDFAAASIMSETGHDMTDCVRFYVDQGIDGYYTVYGYGQEEYSDSDSSDMSED